MLVQFLPGAAPAGAEAMLRDRAGPEQVCVIGREVYIDYRAGVGCSALSPAFLERALGQSGTARNWNTLLRLLEAVRARAEI